MSDIRSYAFINAKVRAKRAFLLSEADYSDLCEAKNIYESLLILSRTRYKEMAERLESQTVESIEKELHFEEIDQFLKLMKVSRGSAQNFLDALILNYDGEKLKALLRAWQSKTPLPDSFYAGKITIDFPISDLLSAIDLEQFIELLRDTNFYEPLKSALTPLTTRNRLFDLEIAIDKFLYLELWNLTAKMSRTDQEIVRRIVGVEIDLKNLEWIARAKKYYQLQQTELESMLIPHGYHLTKNQMRKITSTGSIGDGLSRILPGVTLPVATESEEIQSLSALEIILDQALFIEANRAFLSFPLSIGSTVGYYYLAKCEMRNLKAIFNAKSYGLTPEETEALLVR
ncbi:MAG: V-type ATPase subunit [Candidatus Neomarinimicrobiota bacterium]